MQMSLNTIKEDQPVNNFRFCLGVLLCVFCLTFASCSSAKYQATIRFDFNEELFVDRITVRYCDKVFTDAGLQKEISFPIECEGRYSVKVELENNVAYLIEGDYLTNGFDYYAVIGLEDDNGFIAERDYR